MNEEQRFVQDLNNGMGQALYYLNGVRESLAKLRVMNPQYDLYDPLPEPWMDKVLTLLEEHVILDAQMVKGVLVEVLHNPLVEISVADHEKIVEIMTQVNLEANPTFEAVGDLVYPLMICKSCGGQFPPASTKELEERLCCDCWDEWHDADEDTVFDY